MRIIKQFENFTPPKTNPRFDINLIKKSKEFIDLEKLAKIHKKVIDSGKLSIVSASIVDEYDTSIKLLEDTVKKFNSNQIDIQGVKNTIDKKIVEVNRTTTMGYKPAETFKQQALKLLNFIKLDLIPKYS